MLVSSDCVACPVKLDVRLVVAMAMVLPPSVPLVQARAPQVSVPVNVGLTSACVACPVRLGMRLVVAIVFPPNVPLVQVNAPQVSVPVNEGLALGAQLLS